MFNITENPPFIDGTRSETKDLKSLNSKSTPNLETLNRALRKFKMHVKIILRSYQSRQDEIEEWQRLTNKRLLDMTSELFQDTAAGY